MGWQEKAVRNAYKPFVRGLEFETDSYTLADGLYHTIYIDKLCTM